jgi:hypothetical protein
MLAAHLGQRHVQLDTPLHALQELGGWESAEMVARYAHFSAEHLAPYEKGHPSWMALFILLARPERLLRTCLCSAPLGPSDQRGTLI